MSLPGLPPLPKSLSGFKLQEYPSHLPPTPIRTSSIRSTVSHSSNQMLYPESNVHLIPIGGSSRRSSNLDTKLAVLKQEMYNLRQLDLSVLSQLWSLNESIQDYRQMLQEQEDRVLSPPSPSPTPSSGEDMDGEEFYMSATSLSFRSTAAVPPGRRTSNSSNTSSLG
ncbi:leucine repeat adapter protein 25-like [Diorhabda sublineata]|uniref:leucine repeat adapter protein 25-like n=1 Tax=Diorhabda sublineata TaxID=1163346 RepID=UPI0024E16CDA|nr:leucine repeat adapter protein 25-like [Diorhabda sublineata]